MKARIRKSYIVAAAIALIAILTVIFIHYHRTGRIIMYNGVPIRFGQDAAPVYATKVRAFRITKLTPTEYREVPIEDNPILQGSGTGWNAAGMHTIDAHQLDKDNWMVAVDGFSRARLSGWRY